MGCHVTCARFRHKARKCGCSTKHASKCAIVTTSECGQKFWTDSDDLDRRAAAAADAYLMHAHHGGVRVAGDEADLSILMKSGRRRPARIPRKWIGRLINKLPLCTARQSTISHLASIMRRRAFVMATFGKGFLAVTKRTLGMLTSSTRSHTACIVIYDRSITVIY